MVSFNNLVICLTALVSACSAYGHNHLHRRGHLAARQNFNGTETSIAYGTGTAAGSPPLYTVTVTQTNTKLMTVAYTLGDGRIKTTTIIKAEETTQTIAHVKSTVTVTPIVETTPAAVASPSSVESVASAAASLDASALSAAAAQAASSAKSKSTSTTTLIVTVPNGASTVTVEDVSAATAAVTPSAACSVETVYVPQYVTLYSTVTVSAAAAPSVHSLIVPPYSNNTMSTVSYDSTSTTTMSVYTTVFVTPSASASA